MFFFQNLMIEMNGTKHRVIDMMGIVFIFMIE
jgi:hypothetical protein